VKGIFKILVGGIPVPPAEKLKDYLVREGLPIDAVTEETMPTGVLGYVIEYRELEIMFDDLKNAIQSLPNYRTLGLWKVGTLFLTFTTGQFRDARPRPARAATAQEPRQTGMINSMPM
jgi:hypothetical protein